MSKKEPIRKKCSKCEKLKNLSRDYYASNSSRHSDGRVSICKQCLVKGIEVKDLDELYSKKYVAKVQDILLEINRPYLFNEWSSAIEEAKEKKASSAGVIGYYLKNVQLNHKNKNWLDSEYEDKSDNSIENKSFDKKTTKQKINDELNNKNEKDVLRLLGYDPFEHELEEDKFGLYNKLIDYLTEDVLEDAFRLSSVISIVRSFHQVDRIDAVMATSKSNELGALIKAKSDILRFIQTMAKENGISVGNNRKSSAGSGTFTGIMKQLQEYEFDEVSVNLFDIETAKGLEQVANISNKNISEQLKFDENDMSEMIKDQGQLISEYEKRAKEFEEKNRVLRIKLKEKESIEQELKKEIEELKGN